MDFFKKIFKHFKKDDDEVPQESELESDMVLEDDDALKDYLTSQSSDTIPDELDTLNTLNESNVAEIDCNKVSNTNNSEIAELVTAATKNEETTDEFREFLQDINCTQENINKSDLNHYSSTINAKTIDGTLADDSETLNLDDFCKILDNIEDNNITDAHNGSHNPEIEEKNDLNDCSPIKAEATSKNVTLDDAMEEMVNLDEFCKIIDNVEDKDLAIEAPKTISNPEIKEQTTTDLNSDYSTIDAKTIGNALLDDEMEDANLDEFLKIFDRFEDYDLSIESHKINRNPEIEDQTDTVNDVDTVETNNTYAVLTNVLPFVCNNANIEINQRNTAKIEDQNILTGLQYENDNNTKHLTVHQMAKDTQTNQNNFDKVSPTVEMNKDFDSIYPLTEDEYKILFGVINEDITERKNDTADNDSIISISSIDENDVIPFKNRNESKNKSVTNIKDTNKDNVSIISISSEENDNTVNEIEEDLDNCSYHSSDFEFITEDEAKMGGLITNYTNIKLTSPNNDTRTTEIPTNMLEVANRSQESVNVHDINVPGPSNANTFKTMNQSKPSVNEEFRPSNKSTETDEMLKNKSQEPVNVDNVNNNQPGPSNRNNFRDYSHVLVPQEPDYRPNHRIPDDEEYLNLFRGQYAPAYASDLFFLENKSIRSRTCMNLQYEGMGFNMRMPMEEPEDEELNEEAEETSKKLQSLYPGNRKRRF